MTCLQNQCKDWFWNMDFSKGEFVRVVKYMFFIKWNFIYE